jgi:hypothetical protein
MRISLVSHLSFIKGVKSSSHAVTTNFLTAPGSVLVLLVLWRLQDDRLLSSLACICNAATIIKKNVTTARDRILSADIPH